MLTVPSVGSIAPAKMLQSVDFPAPFGPIITITSPELI